MRQQEEDEDTLLHWRRRGRVLPFFLAVAERGLSVAEQVFRNGQEELPLLTRIPRGVEGDAALLGQAPGRGDYAIRRAWFSINSPHPMPIDAQT